MEVGLGPRCHIYIFNLQHTTWLLISQDHTMNSKSILGWKMFFANKLNITPEDLSPKPWRRKIIFLTPIFLIQCPAEQLPFSWAGRLQCRKHGWLAHVSPEPSILSARNNDDLKRGELRFPECLLHPGPVLNARYVVEHLILISQLWYLHFTDETAKAQLGWVTCQRTHGNLCQPRQAAFRNHVFIHCSIYTMSWLLEWVNEWFLITDNLSWKGLFAEQMLHQPLFQSQQLPHGIWYICSAFKDPWYRHNTPDW